MQKQSIEEAIEHIIKKDPRYPKDVYHFIRDALNFTIKRLKKTSAGSERHVSGKELLEGLRAYALQQFGPLTHTVLAYWNIHQSEDVGEVVYNMVNMHILKTTEKDSQGDFQGGYDFEEAFQKPFEPQRKPLRKSSSRSAKVGPVKPT